MACRHAIWDHSSTAQTGNIVNRLMHVHLEPESSNISNPSLHADTSDHTEIINIPIPYRHPRWDLIPTARVRNTVKKLMHDHFETDP